MAPKENVIMEGGGGTPHSIPGVERTTAGKRFLSRVSVMGGRMQSPAMQSTGVASDLVCLSYDTRVCKQTVCSCLKYT